MKFASTSKKLTAIALSSALASSVAACGSGDGGNPSQGAGSATSNPTSPHAQQAESLEFPDGKFVASRIAGEGDLSNHDVSIFSLSSNLGTGNGTYPDTDWALGVTMSEEAEGSRGSGTRASGLAGEEMEKMINNDTFSLWTGGDCAHPIHPKEVVAMRDGMLLQFDPIPGDTVTGFKAAPGYLTMGDKNLCQAAADVKEERGKSPISDTDAVGIDPSQSSPFSAAMVLGPPLHQ